MRQPNKILFNQKWAKNFVAKRLKKYWPNAKKIISLEIQVIKVFLGYLRFTLRYRVLFEDNLGEIKEKNIIVKAERKKKIKWPPRIGLVQRDYLATAFLRRKNLKSLVPLPLEFNKRFHAYFYEEIAGENFKEYLLGKSWRFSQFLRHIPGVMTALKKIHAIGQKPDYARGNHREEIEKELGNWSFLIKKYYPAGAQRFGKIVEIVSAIGIKYRKIIFDKKIFCVTHGDFQNDNIIIGPDKKISFIDFSDSKFFNPLDDLSSFLVQSELHLKYVKSKIYQRLISQIRRTSYRNYFGRKIKPLEKLQIDFFSAKDILRIITFVSFTQKNWQIINDHSRMMDDLLSSAEKKVKNLEKKYL